MYIGNFEDIMPFDQQEQDAYINKLKEILTEGKDHSYTNFEICTLRTIRAMQQIIALKDAHIEQLESRIAEIERKVKT